MNLEYHPRRLMVFEGGRYSWLSNLAEHKRIAKMPAVRAMIEDWEKGSDVTKPRIYGRDLRGLTLKELIGEHELVFSEIVELLKQLKKAGIALRRTEKISVMEPFDRRRARRGFRAVVRLDKHRKSTLG